MKISKFGLLLLTALLLTLPLIAQNNNCSINVNVSNIESTNGVILASLYSSSNGFPSDPSQAYMVTSGSITEHISYFTFDNVLSGTYAISVVHDANNNGKMDKTWFGKPEEGIGSSNNPKIYFGPPAFKSSSFNVSTSTLNIQIQLNYLSR